MWIKRSHFCISITIHAHYCDSNSGLVIWRLILLDHYCNLILDLVSCSLSLNMGIYLSLNSTDDSLPFFLFLSSFSSLFIYLLSSSSSSSLSSLYFSSSFYSLFVTCPSCPSLHLSLLVSWLLCSFKGRLPTQRVLLEFSEFCPLLFV